MYQKEKLSHYIFIFIIFEMIYRHGWIDKSEGKIKH